MIQKRNRNLSNSIFKIEMLIKHPPTKKTASPDGFPWEFYQTFKKEIIVILHELFYKIETVSNSFYEVNITLSKV